MNIESALCAERIEADVNNTNMLLSPGMYAEAIIESGGSNNAFAVPKSAVLYNTTEGKYIFVGDDVNHLKKVSVSTGNQSSDSIEIFGDFKQGEKIVIDPDDGLNSKVQ